MMMLKEVDPSQLRLLCQQLLQRPENSHKGSFGNALLVGGSRGMAGAIGIAGMSCLRAGAGLVTVAVPAVSLDVVASYHPGYMTLPLACDDAGRLVLDALSDLQPSLIRATCLAVGPGLGRSAESDNFVERLVVTNSLETEHPIPVVIDADALNALSGSMVFQRHHRRREVRDANQADIVLTPHPGEWERWTGVPAKDRQGQIQAATDVAVKLNAVVVLKGHRTWITDGRFGHFNHTGNPSMATGGSGDCLTGIIAALICQGLNCFEAAILGTHLHGLSADIAHRKLRTPSTLPTDLIHELPEAFRSMQN
jgi:NAD(P)H-hydrate epimerase